MLRAGREEMMTVRSPTSTKAAPKQQTRNRRDVVTGALIGLGASILVQPNGGAAHAKPPDKAPWKKKK
jgi:hypothetical protein